MHRGRSTPLLLGQGTWGGHLKLHGSGAGMSVAVRSGNVLSNHFYAQKINIICVNGSTILVPMDSG